MRYLYSICVFLANIILVTAIVASIKFQWYQISDVCIVVYAVFNGCLAALVGLSFEKG